MDYAVKVSVRNGRILRRMKECGIDSQAELARRAGVGITLINAIVALREKPVRANGQWRDVVERVAGVLSCDPDDLFTEAQRGMELATNSYTSYMGEREMQSLMASDDMESAVWARIEAEKVVALAGSERNQSVMRARFEGATLVEAGEEFGLSPERVRQIECKTIRKTKHPSFKNRWRT